MPNPNDGVELSYSSALKLARAYRMQMGQVRNPGNREQDTDRRSDSPWFTFKNVSAETAPGYAIMAVTTGFEVDSDNGSVYNRIPHCTKPSTVFVRLYAVSSPQATEPGAYGLCRFSGPAEMLYTTGTPLELEGWGPEPDTWGVTKGWPQTTIVVGPVSSTQKILLGSLEPIRTVVARTTSAIAAGSTAGVAASGTATVWTGGSGTFIESSPKQSFTGYNFSSVASTTADFYGFTERNGLMCMDSPPGSAGSGPRMFRALLNGALTSATTSAGVDTSTPIDGGSTVSITTARNYLRWAGADNDPCLITQDVTAGTTVYILTAVAWDTQSLVDNVYDNTSEISQSFQEIITKINSVPDPGTVIPIDDTCP